LNYFGSNTGKARRRYSTYVKAGIDQGRKPELVGGGLIRSLGGWSEVKKLLLMGMICLTGDERILGDTDFVQAMLPMPRSTLNVIMNCSGWDMI